jgi:hypothetical protein
LSLSPRPFWVKIDSWRLRLAILLHLHIRTNSITKRVDATGQLRRCNWRMAASALPPRTDFEDNSSRVALGQKRSYPAIDRLVTLTPIRPHSTASRHVSNGACIEVSRLRSALHIFVGDFEAHIYSAGRKLTSRVA